MKKMICSCMAALTMLFALAGCSAGRTAPSAGAGGAPTGKVVVNFEGTIAAIDGDTVTLDNGKIVVVSSDTVFAGDPDTSLAVSEELQVGRFIQGYTDDDPDAAQVSAKRIYYNAPAQTPAAP